MGPFKLGAQAHMHRPNRPRLRGPRAAGVQFWGKAVLRGKGVSPPIRFVQVHRAEVTSLGYGVRTGLGPGCRGLSPGSATHRSCDLG